jgi:hypothetical protein
MPTILKCPNPTCPFRFDASTVPAGAVVACPQCRYQFTLDPLPPPAEPSSADLTADRPRSRKVIEKPSARGTGASGSVLLAVMAVGAAALIGGGVMFVGYLAGWFTPAGANRGPATKFDEYAVSIPVPPDPWFRDEPTRAALGVNLLAFRNADAPGWIAVEAKKYDAAAKAGELRPRVVERLTRQFDELDAELTAEETTFLGRPGEKYTFRGVYRPTGAACRGEVYAAVAKNFAYWVYTWAPDAEFDTHADTFAQFRTGVSVSVSGGSAPAAPKRTGKSFRTKSGLFTLIDGEGLWAEMANPTFQDAAAELWLKGTGRSAATGQPTSQKADVVVVVLDPDGDPRAQAQDHVLKQVADGATVEEQTGPPAGDAPTTGEVAPTDAVTRLRLKYGPEFDAGVNKLAVFAAVDVGKRRVVAYALCPLSQAGYWEQRLMLIVGTLTAGK